MTFVHCRDHVYLKRLSTEYRSILSADMSTDSRPISRLILGRYISRNSADISTDVNRYACRLTPGRYFTATRPTVGRYFTDIRRIMCIYIDRVSVDTIGRYVDRQSSDISTDISAETRPTYRPTSKFVHHNLQNNVREFDRDHSRTSQELITYLPGRKVRELLKILSREQPVQLRPSY